MEFAVGGKRIKKNMKNEWKSDKLKGIKPKQIRLGFQKRRKKSFLKKIFKDLAKKGAQRNN